MRSIWSGSLSFGLINIPIKLYSASEERALKFKLIDKKSQSPINYARIARFTKKEVPYENIVKGFEYEKGQYVILTDDDFEKVAPKKSKTVDIMSFVDESEVSSEYIDKPYFLEPEPKAKKAYVLLREALKRAKKVGIAKWVLRNKEHIAMVRPHGKALMLIQLRYGDELRSPEDLHLPGKEEFSARELEIAVMLIKQLQDHFDASKYKDTYTDELRKIIDRKAKGKPIRIPDEREPVPTNMKDLMEALRESLEMEKRNRSHKVTA